MVALTIILSIIGVAIWVITGLVCSRICVEIIRAKKLGYNEFLWFWFGFFFTWLAILLATITKKNTDIDE